MILFNRSEGRDGRGADHGFTLIELLVVLIILGLMGTIVMGHGPSRSARLELHEGARQIASILREAHARSFYTDRAQSLMIAPTSRVYRMTGQTPHSLPDITISPMTRNVFSFYPDGSVLGPTLTLSLGASRISLKVDKLTGAVKMQGD